ncbi:HAMP domain-containing protein, partial [Geodermatophilus sp. YIM 151500]|uniref:HAMP domain-containing protein n=1 Tax=Geodermatophilus sp. YIM 151500 TaxID=2984531 RepID=UPI0021E35BA7
MSPSTTTRRRGGWFAGRPVGVKIGAAVGLLAVVVLGTNALAVQRISEMRNHQATIYEENLLPLNSLAEVQRAHAAHRVRTLEYAVSTPERRIELKEQMEEKNADLAAGLEAYEPYITAPEAMETFLATREEFLGLVETELFPAADTGDLVGFAQVQSEQLQPLLQVIADELEAEGVAQSAQADARNAEAAAEADGAITLLVATALSAVAVAIALTALIVRRITRTVRSVQRSAEAMAAGDLTVPTGVDSPDELGRMAAAIDAAQGSLREVLSSVVSSADAV